MDPLLLVFLVVDAVALVALLAMLVLFPRLLLLMLKNLRRNLLRTTLTCMAIFVLVFVVTMIWSFLHMLDSYTTAKAGEQKGLVTERWQFPSMLPWSYVKDIEYELNKLPEEYRPTPVTAAGL